MNAQIHCSSHVILVVAGFTLKRQVNFSEEFRNLDFSQVQVVQQLKWVSSTLSLTDLTFISLLLKFLVLWCWSKH
jgi:hypothetical protein